MHRGFATIHRKIFDDPLYFSEPFTKAQAWIDLILLANHKDGVVYKRGNRIEVKRGVVGYSKLALSKRWQWSDTKVDKFIKDMILDRKIKEQKISKITTLFQILNYDEYQTKKEQTEEQTEEQKRNRKGTEKEQKRTNNNDNNDNKEEEKKDIKKKFGDNENILLTQTQYDELLNEYGEKLVNEKIDSFDLKIANKENNYVKKKNHYATIKNWCKKDIEQKPEQKKQKGFTRNGRYYNTVQELRVYAKNSISGISDELMEKQIKNLCKEIGVEYDR